MCNTFLAFFKTLIVNFRGLPFSQAIFLPIIIFDSKLKLTSIGKIRIEGTLSRGMIEIGKGFFSTIGRGELMNSGTLIFYGKCSILRGTLINNQGVIRFGHNSHIGEHMKIIIKESLEIGTMCRMAFSTIIMDTSGHPILDLSTGYVKRFFKGIRIGNYCWIGNSCSINAGTVLPDYVIVGNRSLLNKDYTHEIQQFSLIGGVPAKLLKKNVLRVSKESVWFSYIRQFEQDIHLASINASSDLAQYGVKELSNF